MLRGVRTHHSGNLSHATRLCATTVHWASAGSRQPDRPEAALSDPVDTLHLEHQVCLGLSIASRGVIAAYKPLLEPLGLTHPQYLVMVALWQYGPLSVKELGGLLALDSGTLSPLLKRLETIGVVQRRRGVSDERSVTVSVTEQGEQMRERAQQVHGGVVEQLGLEPAELEQLRRALERVIAATTRSSPA